jgi:hypothetical protein
VVGPLIAGRAGRDTVEDGLNGVGLIPGIEAGIVMVAEPASR